MRTVRFYLASGDVGSFRGLAVRARKELGPLTYERVDAEDSAAIFDLDPWNDCSIDMAVQYFVGVVRRYLLDHGAWSSPFGGSISRILFLDIESHGVEKRWSMTPRDFFRLGQYAWGEGPVALTEDYDEVISAIREADGVVVHNGHNFDLSVLFGKDSDEPLCMTMDRRVIDTMVLANIAYPAPSFYKDRAGRPVATDLRPSNVRRWLSLDNLAYQMGLEGKVMDLKDLAKQFNPPGTKASELDFGLIPLDDPTFREYSEQDVVVLRGIFKELLMRHEVNEYDWREQLKAAINAQMSRNGFLIDEDKVYDRLYALADRKEKLLDYLHKSVGMPLDSKQPWRTNVGKQCVIDALAAFGVDEYTHPEWPRTPTGALQLSGSVVQDLLRGHGSHAEAFGKVLGELLGQRSLAQLTIDCLQPDGRVHPEVDDLQRSGRSSTTKPGLTVWTARGDNAVEKSYFIPDPGCKLVSFDYSNADARIVAGYAQDPAYMENFKPGADPHEITGRAVWGDEEYEAHMPEGWEADTEARKRNPYRQKAKALSHAWNYGGGAKTISKASGQPLDIAEHFVKQMAKAYPRVVEWRQDCADQGENGWIYNAWGRRMSVNVERSYTQSSALMGQSGTREIMTDALIRMLKCDIRLIHWLRAQIHDELIFSIPETELEWAVPKIAELMSTTWNGVEFTAAHGQPADDWEHASH